MARHQFRLFANVSFLQSVDKPRFLSRLLTTHRDYFARQGVDVGNLANDDACVRGLLQVFARADERMPGPLLNTLYLLDHVADEDGMQRMLEEAERLGIDLRAFPDDASPGDFAILAYLQHRDLVRICHEKTVVRKIKRYYEYRSRCERRFSLADVEAAIEPMKDTLGPWFHERKRSRACEIFVYQEGDEIRVLITHGGLFRADGNVTDKLELSRLPWRPQKHDSIIYDTKTGVLKVHAQFENERQVYRETTGQILAGDAGYFLDNPCYTLEPLRWNSGELGLPHGVEAARLTEVAVEADCEDCNHAQFKGPDLTRVVAGCGTLPFPAGEIVRACFAISYASGGRPRKLELRLYNVADYNRERDGAAAEAFIRVNGLFASDVDGLAGPA